MNELYDSKREGRIQYGRGDGHYPNYFALWHLFEIEVVKKLEKKTLESDAWKEADAASKTPGFKKTRVALLDVSVAYRHPNLEPAIATDLMIDFFSARLGTFPAPIAGGTRLGDLVNNSGAAPTSEALVGRLLGELKDHLPREYKAAAEATWRVPRRVHPATNPEFSAHGTAMAGLIGAVPRPAGTVPAAPTGLIPLPGHDPLPATTYEPSFPYAGVDPFCEIVPISTSFDPDPEQLILAMLYAHVIDADLIVVARDFPDPFESTITGRRGPAADEERQLLAKGYPVPLEGEAAHWKALRELTVKMAETRPIVCAAGNGGDEAMILPAALATAQNGIIAVGAANPVRRRAGYSSIGIPGIPGRAEQSAITIYAPSGDGERLDHEVQRLDIASPDFRRRDHSDEYVDQLHLAFNAEGNPVTKDAKGEPFEEPDSTFATQEIVSTDVPGAAGYNSSIFPASEGPIDFRSFYCHFSGTSAATAITAGMLSLAMTTGLIPRGDGPGAKRMLRGDAGPTDDKDAKPYLSWSTVVQQAQNPPPGANAILWLLGSVAALAMAASAAVWERS